MKKPAPKKKRTDLHDEEDALWSYAASSIEPLKRAKPRVTERGRHASDDEPLPPRRKAENATDKTTISASKKTSPAVAAPTPSKKTAPPIADFDRKKMRKIRSGQIDIEARIDLHGMVQAEAHAALRAFLARCQTKAQRWVLVITGKGKPLTTHHDDTRFTGEDKRVSGVLKRNVPRWLDEPDLRPLVVSYTQAAPHHGGDGALYVHLRTKGRG